MRASALAAASLLLACGGSERAAAPPSTPLPVVAGGGSGESAGEQAAVAAADTSPPAAAPPAGGVPDAGAPGAPSSFSRDCPGVDPALIRAQGRTEGRISPTPIREAVRANVAAVRRCYERTLLRDPNAEGLAAFMWVIGPDGRVASVSLRDTSAAFAFQGHFASCMIDEICTWQFPASGSGIVRVTYPFRFQPTDVGNTPP